MKCRPHWKPYLTRNRNTWTFRIGHLVGSVTEEEAPGFYKDPAFVDSTPRVFLARIGNRIIPHVASSEATKGILHHPTAESAAESVERIAVATAHEILQEMEPPNTK